MIEITGEGKSAVATPDGKKPKEEEEERQIDIHTCAMFLLCLVHPFRSVDDLFGDHITIVSPVVGDNDVN